jgi:hypothetical protein
MFKKAAFVLLVALVVATTGRADTFVTGSETVNQAAPGFGGSGSTPFVIRAVGTSLGGYEFANDITSVGAPKAGDVVNIIEVDNFSQFNQANPPGGVARQNSPNFVTVVIAAQATVNTVNGQVATGVINKATAGFFTTPTFNPQSPATWASQANPLASYSLAGQIGVVPGKAANGSPAEGDFFLPGQINTFSINLTTPTLFQGTALFKEVNNGGYLNVDLIPGTIGLGQLGIYAEQLNAGTLPTLSAADMAEMNALFNTLLPGTSAFGFANFGSANADGFNPNAAAGTGDSEFTFGTNVDPGNFTPQVFVPEPATLSLWGLILGSGAVGGVVRRFRSRKAKKAA